MLPFFISLPFYCGTQNLHYGSLFLTLPKQGLINERVDHTAQERSSPSTHRKRAISILMRSALDLLIKFIKQSPRFFNPQQKYALQIQHFCSEL